jgi:uncharacterized protein YecE (DUF72 family)
MGKTSTPVIATASLVYARFHGPEAAYRTGYSDTALADWAKLLLDAGGKELWVYFNNDIGGHAPRDAQRLLQILLSKAR